MLFVKLSNETVVAASRIERIGRPYERKKEDLFRFCDMRLAGNEIVSVPEYEAEDFLHAPTQIMPAAAGTYIVQPSDDCTEAWRTPVVGWAVAVSGDFLPLTAAGVYRPVVPGERTFVLHPDGLVVATDNGESWPTVLNLLEEERGRRDADPAPGAEAPSDARV